MVDVKIYLPTKSAMQSGRGKLNQWVIEFEPGSAKALDPLMGWVASADTRGQVRMCFDSKDQAIGFAERNGLGYRIEEPRQRRIRPKAYADNFAFDRVQPWSH